MKTSDCPPTRCERLEAENTRYREALTEIAQYDTPHYRDDVYTPQALAKAALRERETR